MHMFMTPGFDLFGKVCTKNAFVSSFEFVCSCFVDAAALRRWEVLKCMLLLPTGRRVV